MRNRIPFNALVLTVALLIAAGPYVVRAAGVRPDTAITAMVDLQRVFGESDNRKNGYVKADEYAKGMELRFNEIAGLQYLNIQEVKELHQAMNREMQTDADKKRIAELKEANNKRSDEMRTLSTKKEGELTAAEKTRLRDLNALVQQHAANMEDLRRACQDMVNGDLEREMRKGLAEIREIVAKLAKDQGISQVFDTSSLVYSQIDLTPAALLKVRKK